MLIQIGNCILQLKLEIGKRKDYYVYSEAKKLKNKLDKQVDKAGIYD